MKSYGIFYVLAFVSGLARSKASFTFTDPDGYVWLVAQSRNLS